MLGTPAPYRSLLRSTIRPGRVRVHDHSEANQRLGLGPATRIASIYHHLQITKRGFRVRQIMVAPVLTFVTGNANKLREVEEILASGGVPLVMQSRNIDLPEVQGTAVEVSREKCRRATEIVGGPCITEDTSLGFVALNGLPGPYIKWFLREVGTEGLNKMLDGFETRAAFAQCNFAYSKGPGFEPIVFEGRTEGRIVLPRGPSKFGWDPVFEPIEGEGKTYAEMSSEAKNKISHRYRSLEKLRKYLEEESK